MDKRVAVITGATGGLGREFVKAAVAEGIDEIWAVARKAEPLERLKAEFADKVRTLSVDLTDKTAVEELAKMFEEENPNITLLINNAGVLPMGAAADQSADEIEREISLNCTAVALLCKFCLPFMKKGSHIINVSSLAASQPLPYMSIYAASKAFVLNYSLALNRELVNRGVAVMAVCPGWIETDLLTTELNGNKVEYPGLVKPEPVVKKAMRDMHRGKTVSAYTFRVKALRLLSKIAPSRTAIWFFMRWMGKIAEEREVI